MGHRHIRQSFQVSGLLVLVITCAASADCESWAADLGVPPVGASAGSSDVDFDRRLGLAGGGDQGLRNGVPTLGEVGIIILTVAFGLFGVLLLRKNAPAEH